MRPRWSLLGVLLAVSCGAFAWTLPTATVMVPMTDGTQLATDYYLPTAGGPAWPVILARTAYPKAVAMRSVDLFVRQGYAGVVQDIRGFGYSKGLRDPFFADGWRPGMQDGAETVDWIKRQPWCNGKVATMGESALGITQVLLAPPTRGVACQFIELAPSNFYFNMAYRGGVWCKNLAEGWMTLLGFSDVTQRYKDHPYYDEFWTWYNAEAKAADVTAPAVHVGCWYDIFQQGTINNFVTRQTHGGPGAKGNQKLIIKGGAHVGYDERDFKYPPNRSEVRIGEIRDKLFAHWLKGDANDVMQPPSVYYYVMGDDRDPDAPGLEWRTADAWPPVPTTDTPYYLAPNGALVPEAGTEPASASFVYDPRNPTPTWGGANLFLPSGPFDQRTVTKGRTDVLKFATAPLTAPVEITGQVFVRLHVSTDAPDTDFTAKLVDVFPPGDEREILMLDGIQRVKLRRSFEKPEPLLTSPDQVVEVTVDLWSISWIVNTNHRIGLEISSSNYPRFELNPNTGDDFPTQGKFRAARNTVHMGKASPSALVLPARK